MPQQQHLQHTSNAQHDDNNTSCVPSAAAQYQDVVQSADLFWENLKAFHKSLGKKFKVPVVGGKTLDLHRLFVEVTARGGIEKVIRDRKWKEVIMVFKFPTTITSASFVLRKYYLSILYHFEQVYYFRKQVSAITMSETGSECVINGLADIEESASTNQSTNQGTVELQHGSWVTGTIDGKFDNGYLVTVRVGSDELKGVLYHIPQMPQEPQGPSNLDVPPRTIDVPPRRQRKRSRLLSRDPFRPKSNRSGYNFFFAEHYARLKPLYHGQERAISKKIGHLWNNLSEAEKQVYQEKGVKDKERYRSEMMEYKSSYETTPQ